MPNPDHKTNWQQTLDVLQNQMTRGTYETWLKQTTARTGTNGHYIVMVKSDHAQAWLQHRLAELCRNTLKQVDPTAQEISFVVAPQQLVTDKRPGAAPTVTSNVDLAHLDYDAFYTATGYTKFPHYVNTFWRLYLGRAFDLWALLQAQQLSPAQYADGWTPVKRFRFRELARKLRASINTVKGGVEGCYYLRLARQLESPLAQCCGRCATPHWNDEAEPPTCNYWRTGLLEILHREGILAVAEAKASQPRQHHLRLQVWRWLPLLTPQQVIFLSEPDQDQHERWLEKFGSRAEPPVSVMAWEGEERPSLIGPMSSDDKSRLLFDDYQPNPFPL